MYAFIDESGDDGLTKKSSKHFIIASICVTDENILSKIARKVFKAKILNKHKKDQLHATSDNPKVHKAILKELDKIKYQIIFNSDKNYLNNLKTIFKKLKEIKVDKVYLAIRDHRKKTIQEIYKLGKDSGLEIIQTTTTKEKGLQIADFISWSIFRKYEFGDTTYFDQIFKNEK